MSRYRHISWALLAWLWLGLPVVSPALDVNPVSQRDVGEATQFFSDVAHKSRNPLIAQMARDSLQQLQAVSTGQGESKQKAPARKTTAEVALLPQYDHTFVVPATVNRRYMATFLIDTGASYTVITPKMAEALGLTVNGDSPTVPVTTANGVLHAPVVRLKNVSLGGLQVDNVDAVVTELGDSPQLSGLLGMSFFQGMDLSFRQDRLVISR
jgi:clan AA aspartic protease (TIGR02281 family)